MNLFRRARGLDDRVVEAVLAGRTPADRPELAELAELLLQARTAAPTEPPAASERLTAIFDKGVVPVVVPLRTGPVLPAARRTTGTGWRVALLGTAAIAAVLIAAEANALPAPAQTAVANVVEAITPLTVPRPAKAVKPAQPVQQPGPSLAPRVGPTRPVAPRPRPQHVVSPGPSPSARLVGPDVVILPPPSAEPTIEEATPEPEPAPEESPDG